MATVNTKVNQTYINWVLASNRGIMGHFYQFTSANGVNDYFTDLDIDIDYNGNIYKSGALRFEGMQRKLGIGFNVDEQSIKIWASPTDTLFGATFLPNVEQGLLDGAVIVRSRAIWSFNTGNAATDISVAPLAVWPLFTGYTSQITKGGTSHIELKVKSALMRLTTNMPRNYYQPGCLWTLFSSGCTLVKSAYAQNGSVGSGFDSIKIPVSGGVYNPTSADGIATYAKGRLLFTSGVNDNLQCFVDTNDSSSLYLAYPLNNLPSMGDTFTYYPGCSKSYNTCSLKFNNENNYRGFDKVPPVMVSM